MKSDSLPKDFPDSREAWEKLISDAPGEDREPTAEEQAMFSGGFTSSSFDEFKEKLAIRRHRGSGRAQKKEPTTIRFSPDVLAAFRATGKGWQTRMNDALREWLKTHRAA